LQGTPGNFLEYEFTIIAMNVHCTDGAAIRARIAASSASPDADQDAAFDLQLPSRIAAICASRSGSSSERASIAVRRRVAERA